MFNFTSTTVVNSADRISAAGAGVFRIERGVDLVTANITAVYKTVAAAATKGSATINLTGLSGSATDLYRIMIYLGLQNSANSLYANDFVFKGKPLYFEFKGNATPTQIATMIGKVQKIWSNGYVYVTATGVDTDGSESVTISAVDEYQIFTKVVLQKFTPSTSDLIRDVFEDITATISITQGTIGKGTYDLILSNLRLPTIENLKWKSPNEDEMPIMGSKYDQFIFTYKRDRGVMGGSAMGQLVTSQTNHVVFVKSDLTAGFTTALGTAGFTVANIQTV